MGTRRGFLGKLLGGAAISNLVKFKVEVPIPEPPAPHLQRFGLTVPRAQNIGSVSEWGDLPVPPCREEFEAIYNPTGVPIEVELGGIKVTIPHGEARYVRNGRAFPAHPPQGWPLPEGGLRRG